MLVMQRLSDKMMDTEVGLVIATTGDTTGLESSTTKTRVLKFNPERIKIAEDNTALGSDTQS
jgi:hypothetical protein